MFHENSHMSWSSHYIDWAVRFSILLFSCLCDEKDSVITSISTDNYRLGARALVQRKSSLLVHSFLPDWTGGCIKVFPFLPSQDGQLLDREIQSSNLFLVQISYDGFRALFSTGNDIITNIFAVCIWRGCGYRLQQVAPRRVAHT